MATILAAILLLFALAALVEACTITKNLGCFVESNCRSH